AALVVGGVDGRLVQQRTSVVDLADEARRSRPQQRDGSRDVRRGHRGPRDLLVLAVVDRGTNIDAGSGDVRLDLAVLPGSPRGEPGDGVGAVVGADGVVQYPATRRPARRARATAVP